VSRADSCLHSRPGPPARRRAQQVRAARQVRANVASKQRSTSHSAHCSKGSDVQAQAQALSALVLQLTGRSQLAVCTVPPAASGGGRAGRPHLLLQSDLLRVGQRGLREVGLARADRLGPAALQVVQEPAAERPRCRTGPPGTPRWSGTGRCRRRCSSGARQLRLRTRTAGVIFLDEQHVDEQRRQVRQTAAALQNRHRQLTIGVTMTKRAGGRLRSMSACSGR